MMTVQFGLHSNFLKGIPVISVINHPLMQDGSINTGTDESFNNVCEAIKFTANFSGDIRSFGIRIKRTGILTNLTEYIMGHIAADVGGVPGNKIITGGYAGDSFIRYGRLNVIYQEVEFAAYTPLINGTNYWLVLTRSAAPIGGTIEIDTINAGIGQYADSPTGLLGSWTLRNGMIGYFRLFNGTPNAFYGNSPNENSVYGYSSNQYGVWGYSKYQFGVEGFSENSYGVFGWSEWCDAVRGESNAGNGVRGDSITGFGVYGFSIGDKGVRGVSTNDIGIYGYGHTIGGIMGETDHGYGIYGLSIAAGGFGVFGESTNGIGVFGHSNGDTAIKGYSHGWYGGLFRTDQYDNVTIRSEGVHTLTANRAEVFCGGIEISPQFAGNFAITRYNYFNILQPTFGGGANIIDGCLFRFDDIAGTHKVIAAPSIKITPSNVDAWIKININGTLHYIPTYISMVT